MNDKVVPIVPRESGNSKQIPPSKHWIFTLNNYTKEKINLIQFHSSIKRYSFQEEVGESGTPHLQGYIEFITKRRPLPLLKDWGAHFIKCKNSKHCKIKDAIAYTQKEDTRAGKLYLKGIKKIRPLKILQYEELYPWQKEIVDMTEHVPCDRLIHWFWEPFGCRGKTQLCKYLCHHHDAILIDGKKSDMLFQIANCEEVPEIVLMNLPNGSRMPNIKALEAIKDGIFASPKYESKMKLFNSPHIFVFGNMKPTFPDNEYDYSKRWVVRELTPPE